jgi:hypothetical protein
MRRRLGWLLNPYLFVAGAIAGVILVSSPSEAKRSTPTCSRGCRACSYVMPGARAAVDGFLTRTGSLEANES